MKNNNLLKIESGEREHFNKMADVYDANYKYNTPFTAYKINKKVDQLIKIIKEKYGNKKIMILDMGCGTGEYTNKIAEKLPESTIVGIDISDKIIKVAKKKCRKRKNVIFYTGSAYATKFRDNKYDVICGFYFLHHVKIKKVRKEVYRLLKPGGIAFFYEPNILNPYVYLIKSSKTLKKMVGDSPEEWAINPLTISAELKYFEPILITTTEFIIPISFFPLGVLKTIDNFTQLLSYIPFIKMLGGSVKIHLQKPINRKKKTPAIKQNTTMRYQN